MKRNGHITTMMMAAISAMVLSSCSCDNYNHKLSSGSAGSGDSLYRPTSQPFKDSSQVRDTLAPLQMDSTGEETGRMNNTGKGG